MADALAAVAPLSVLWKLSAADQQLLGVGNVTLSHNIRLIEWAPQNDVLGHPATRAFLTQAGTNSFNEVVCLAHVMSSSQLPSSQSDQFSRSACKPASSQLEHHHQLEREACLAVLLSDEHLAAYEIVPSQLMLPTG